MRISGYPSSSPVVSLKPRTSPGVWMPQSAGNGIRKRVRWIGVVDDRFS